MKLSTLTVVVSAAHLAVAASGSFNVLTFNVAGLPEFVNSNGISGGKHDAAIQIGEKFAAGHPELGPYDVINIQEDFEYHWEIYDNDNHTSRTNTSGHVLFGSGLNTLSNIPLTNVTRVKWNKCKGLWAYGSDCLTPKGFTYMQMEIPGAGTTVDVYNLHADAGHDGKSVAARKAGFEQLTEFIEVNSRNQAVLVFGDTNSRYSDPKDEEFLNTFVNRTGLHDVWIVLEHGGTKPHNALECDKPANNTRCEEIDKIWFRSGNRLDLHATSFHYVTDHFLQPDGRLLSDHNAVLAGFEWST